MRSQEAVLSRCEWREVPAGQPIYHASDPQADPCGIVDGTVEIYSRFGGGDNPMLHLAHEGAWVGYGAIRGLPRSISITQDEFATMVNVSRTTLLQILRRFDERGVIEQAYRSLRVVNAAGLKEIAEGRQR